MLLKSGFRVNEELQAENYFGDAVDFDLIPNLDAHQVLAHFQRSGISFSGMRHQVWSVERHDVRIDREFRFHLAENLSRLLRSRVVVDYFLLLLRAEELVAGEMASGSSTS